MIGTDILKLEEERGMDSDIPILVTERFQKSLERYRRNGRGNVEEKIKLLLSNPAQPHPSLKAHRIKKNADFWEMYLTDGDRLIYRWRNGHLELHDIGDHSIVGRFHQSATLAASFPFNIFGSKKAPQPSPAEPRRPLARPDLTTVQPDPAEGSDNCLKNLPEAHLRILGVPKAHVKAVQEAPSFEALEKIDLPPRVLERLQELATNVRLERALREGRLLYRATLDQLVGYVEGKIKRLMLNLANEQQHLVTLETSRPTLVRGCAGSGKTTIAVYRAIHFAKEGKRVLFLTYNKTLALAARTMIEELIDFVPDGLEVSTVDSWLRKLVEQRQGKAPSFFRNEEAIKQAIRQAISAVQRAEPQAFARYLGEYSAAENFLIDEILHVILPSGVTTLEEYLNWRRYGRGTALHQPARRLIWKIYEAYQQARNEQLHWDDLARLAAQMLRARPLQPSYDHIIIDEVQDLSAARLRAILALMDTSPNCNLFMVGDVAQTIYSRGFAWRDLGLNMRGRSLSLRKNFRNTRQIAEAAAQLYAHNQQLRKAEEFVDPEPIERNGPKPTIIECDRASKIQSALREKLLSLIEGETFRLCDFAILAPTNDLCEEYRRALTDSHIAAVTHKEDFNLFEEQVKILTIHSAKGLEFPVVFVVGLQEDILPRKSYALSEEELALHLERERTLLYVAMTRASEGLFLMTSQERPSRFLKEIDAVERESFNA
ncbi:MAG: hypothetical protein CUN50_05270 [Candidatus Thermofonsia Clade 1 bacterium]|uniref:DNA 3'-5' helicase n=1 Tax=Candidatus Thermofonsia Clade 1 bacterium TaxID=2364210 RepID=A0A2M8PX60_9CHLR|nr:MAG: hypothetical protein CUN50_05270 [Candidatus Thermofonsia Clade 1 bacterium]